MSSLDNAGLPKTARDTGGGPERQVRGDSGLWDA